jgi:hypothetical protein
MPEFWDFDLFAINDFLSFGCFLVVVGGFAVSFRDTHVNQAGVFAGSRSIRSHTTSPTFTITGH